MKLLLAGMVLLGLIVVGGFALANYEGNHARVIEAQVALEATRSARAANWTLTGALMLIIVLLVVGIGTYVYFWARMRVAAGMKRVGGEGRYVEGRHMGLPVQEEMPMQRSLEMMMQMQMIQMLRQQERDAPVERVLLPEEVW